MNKRDEMLEVHQLCKVARKALKLRQEKMGQIVSVSVTTMWRWETKKTLPPDTYIAVCEIVLRLKQDGNGLELQASELLQNIPKEKRNSKNALLVLWGFCMENSKAYIINEMTGREAKPTDDFDPGERGLRSMESTLQMMDDFRASMKERIMALPHEVRNLYMTPFSKFSGSIEELKLAQEYEQAMNETQDEPIPKDDSL